MRHLIGWPPLPETRKQPFYTAAPRVGRGRGPELQFGTRPPTPTWLEWAIGFGVCHLIGCPPLPKTRERPFYIATPCVGGAFPHAPILGAPRSSSMPMSFDLGWPLHICCRPLRPHRRRHRIHITIVVDTTSTNKLSTAAVVVPEVSVQSCTSPNACACVPAVPFFSPMSLLRSFITDLTTNLCMPDVINVFVILFRRTLTCSTFCLILPPPLAPVRELCRSLLLETTRAPEPTIDLACMDGMLGQ